MAHLPLFLILFLSKQHTFTIAIPENREYQMLMYSIHKHLILSILWYHGWCMVDGTVVSKLYLCFINAVYRILILRIS